VASAQIAPPSGEVVLEDAIAVQVIDREVVAFDLEGSGRLALRLELDEHVLFHAARGRVALVLTTSRMLGATPASSSWRAERYRISETPVDGAWLSQTLGLVITSERALAFFGPGNWAEQSLGPREDVHTVRLGPAAGVVVTNRRALGISAHTGGFFETRLRINEEIESVTAVSSIATITTTQRTLLFKGPSAVWVEHRRPLR
jgi:predicted RNA-binding protein